MQLGSLGGPRLGFALASLILDMDSFYIYIGVCFGFIGSSFKTGSMHCMCYRTICVALYFSFPCNALLLQCDMKLCRVFLIFKPNHCKCTIFVYCFKVSHHVDHTGKIFMTYITSWSHPDSVTKNCSDLSLHCLNKLFK